MKRYLAIIGFGLSLNLMFIGISNSSGLLGAEWGGEGEIEQFVKFSPDGKVSGYGGCNRFFGSYKTRNKPDQRLGYIKIGPLGSTKKGCKQSIMNAEFEFMKNLRKTVQYNRSLHSLKLRDENGNLIMKLRWRDFD